MAKTPQEWLRQADYDMKKDYGKKKTRNILEKSKEALKWLKRESRK
jgi:hypothetical protein